MMSGDSAGFLFNRLAWRSVAIEHCTCQEHITITIRINHLNHEIPLVLMVPTSTETSTAMSIYFHLLQSCCLSYRIVEASIPGLLCPDFQGMVPFPNGGLFVGTNLLDAELLAVPALLAGDNLKGQAAECELF